MGDFDCCENGCCSFADIEKRQQEAMDHKWDTDVIYGTEPTA